MQRIFGYAADTNRPEALRLAILRGSSLGMASGGRGGGRGGRGQVAQPPPSMTAEPAGLVALSNTTGDLGSAAKQVVNGVTWPGKPTPAVAQQALTPEQEARYKAGQTIYATMCVGCHMDQGQGSGNLGAPLANSRFVIGPTAIAVRIMTAGKESPSGLMPPLGAKMTDEQLAAVLTFIRGSFGNRATPVQPAEVKETRLMYSYRKTPWTERDLTAGRRGGGRGN
jgi:mono/diheme cytochrome c family protein